MIERGRVRIYITYIFYIPIVSVVSWVVLGINAQRGFITKLIKKKKTDINIIVIIAAIEPMNRYIVISLLLSVHRKKTLYAHSVFARTFRDLFAHTRSPGDYSRTFPMSPF